MAHPGSFLYGWVFHVFRLQLIHRLWRNHCLGCSGKGRYGKKKEGGNILKAYWHPMYETKVDLHALAPWIDLRTPMASIQ